jgi:hypothetical protein
MSLDPDLAPDENTAPLARMDRGSVVPQSMNIIYVDGRSYTVSIVRIAAGFYLLPTHLKPSTQAIRFIHQLRKWISELDRGH